MPFIAYDVTRLFLGPISRTPRGIDRIDLILARHFFTTAPQTTVGVLPTPWGVRVYDSARVLRGLDKLEALWAEEVDLAEDRALQWLRARIAGQDPGPAPYRGKLTLVRKALRLVEMVGATGFSFGRPVAAALPEGAAYLNVGQISLALGRFFTWLDRRPDVWAAFMLHDVIPLERPDLVAATSVRFHDQMVATTARHAGGLIVSTQSARAAVVQALGEKGRAGIPTLSVHLPLHAGFDAPVQADPELAAHRYFVVCGAIEPRKNLKLLLEVWTRLVAIMGADTPHLAVVGTPNFKGGEILATFAASSQTVPFIHIVSGLSTPGLKCLIAGARALLMPSLAEGFGLPILEAEALGCPVIASDIPAHREVSGPAGHLLPPHDTEAWLSAIQRVCHAENRPAPESTEILQAARSYFISQITSFLSHRGN